MREIILPIDASAFRVMTPCVVAPPMFLGNEANYSTSDKVKICSAVWDTGAMMTSVSDDVVRELGLEQYGNVKVTHIDGSKTVPAYLIGLLLPNNILFQVICVVNTNLTGHDVLIGMDIITQGDFRLIHEDGKYLLKFGLRG